MERQNEKENSIDEKITEICYDFEEEKEQKLVNLLVKIIVCITLKELYEKGD
jgi:recombination DNA repair RAD52 pathway protein